MRFRSLFFLALISALAMTIVVPPIQATAAVEETAPTQVLFKNVNVFDGKSERLAKGMDVLVVGNKIKEISSSPIQAGQNATIIHGGGRTLMPGMIDGHAT